MPRKNRQIKHIPFKIVNNCDRKCRYKDEKKALEAADYQMLVNQGLEIAVYKCDLCLMWHLTRVVEK